MMAKKVMTCLVGGLVAACAIAQEPVIVPVVVNEYAGATGRRTALSTDLKGQPHILSEAGGTVYFYDKVGGVWSSSSMNTKSAMNSSQYMNPRLEIDRNDRAWMSGILISSTGMGLLLRNNMSTSPSGAIFSRRNPMPSGWPTGNLSVDMYRSEAFMYVSGGWYETYQYDVTASGCARETGSGRMYAGVGGESTRGSVSKAYPVLHSDGVVRSVWHGMAVANAGYDKGKYQNSLRSMAGLSSVVWANPVNYYHMGYDGTYGNVAGDMKDPEIAYIGCDLNSDGAKGGIWGNVYNHGTMTHHEDAIICYDSVGKTGLRRMEPQFAPVKSGGAFLVYERSGYIAMRYVSQRGVLGAVHTISAGSLPSAWTDSAGNIHIAYLNSGVRYAKVLVAGGGESSLAGDFNGDGRDDPTVYDSASGKWFIYNLATGRSMTPAAGFSWGFAGAVPTPGDFDGDGRTDLGVYDSSAGKWHLYNMATGKALTHKAGLAWGFAGGTPVVADYNGDGHDDLGVYDTAGGKWFIYSMASGKSLTPLNGVSWGFAGATPIAADYDGDRRADLGVYDSAIGKWFIYNMATGRALTPKAGLAWGFAGATPIAADYNGDGRADLGVFDSASAKWFIYNLRTGRAIAWNLLWGAAGMTPVKGHYFRTPRFRADDPNNVTVYDSATGKWYIYSIQEHAAKRWGMQWGYAGAIPIGAAN